MPLDTTPTQTTTSSFQRTLAAPISLSGVGLHSGCMVDLRLLPAAPNSGFVFVRSDLPAGQNVVPARYDFVVDTKLCTVIGNEFGARISTVEHVLSALLGAGLDNVRVEVSAEEIPALDGSSIMFMQAIEQAGVVTQAAPRKLLQILKTVEVTNGAKFAALAPSNTGKASYTNTVDYSHSNQRIGKQTASLVLGETDYKTEIASARTFTLFEEVDAMWQAGLGRGGSLDNAVIVWGDEVVNVGGLRYDTEFARHKLLDAVGDLALCGGYMVGNFAGYMTGHALNAQLLRALFADASNYQWVDATTLATSAAVNTAESPQLKAIAR